MKPRKINLMIYPKIKYEHVITGYYWDVENKKVVGPLEYKKMPLIGKKYCLRYYNSHEQFETELITEKYSEVEWLSENFTYLIQFLDNKIYSFAEKLEIFIYNRLPSRIQRYISIIVLSTRSD